MSSFLFQRLSRPENDQWIHTRRNLWRIGLNVDVLAKYDDPVSLFHWIGCMVINRCQIVANSETEGDFLYQGVDKFDAIVTDQTTRAAVFEDYFIDKSPGTTFSSGSDEWEQLHPSGSNIFDGEDSFVSFVRRG